MKTFIELLEDKKSITEKVDYYSNCLQKFKTKNGFIPDNIRFSETFKTHKIGFDIWFKKLQDINVSINRNHKNENREYHKKQRFTKAIN